MPNITTLPTPEMLASAHPQKRWTQVSCYHQHVSSGLFTSDLFLASSNVNGDLTFPTPQDMSSLSWPTSNSSTSYYHQPIGSGLLTSNLFLVSGDVNGDLSFPTQLSWPDNSTSLSKLLSPTHQFRTIDEWFVFSEQQCQWWSKFPHARHELPEASPTHRFRTINEQSVFSEQQCQWRSEFPHARHDIK